MTDEELLKLKSAIEDTGYSVGQDGLVRLIDEILRLRRELAEGRPTSADGGWSEEVRPVAADETSAAPVVARPATEVAGHPTSEGAAFDNWSYDEVPYWREYGGRHYMDEGDYMPRSKQE